MSSPPVLRRGLPPIRLHDLWHGAATRALAAGTDLKVVQEILGHSSDTYTSVSGELQREAANTIARLIKAAGDTECADLELADTRAATDGPENQERSPS